MAESVILVNQADQMVGTMDKLQAHRRGALHRAFSVFIFNTAGELLLQQRAHNKYHSGGKWTNTCCSHPWLGEKTDAAAHRRLFEEMGIRCTLTEVFAFTYRADVDKDLIEHELDHVYFGTSDDLPVPNSDEVASFKYIAMNDLAADLTTNSDHYTAWLQICFERVTTIYNEISR